MNTPANLLFRLLVLTCAVLGGWVTNRIGIPLAWLIGSMVASGIFAFFGARLDFRKLRPPGLIVLGLSLGQTFTPAILEQMLRNLPIIAICSLGALCSGIVMTRIFSSLAGLDAKTAFYCALPGGVVLMSVQAQHAGASEKHVVLAQTVRLMIVVLVYPMLIAMVLPGHTAQSISLTPSALLPPLADAWKVLGFVVVAWALAYWARKSFIPNPWMIVPCMLAILLGGFDLQPAEMPHGLVAVCQIILGVSLGAQMTPDFIRGSSRLLLASAVSTLLLSAILAPAALFIAYLFDFDHGAVLLGMSPGGMPEMTVAAKTIGVAVPLVLSFHLVRILIGNLLIQQIWWLSCRLRWVTAPA
ncbi:AbrB family transcriptional regulator [Neorhizobium sp. NCHU2750]|uniref:AbrB family transcriptional regulator n=1 Tax=Neorhizobium sp. NCHU2750 TaxID=1825976 RepID=UPI000E71173D|nr:ammonia monooxygenase [Neorhizobium sp. NCHU2750]